MKDSYGIELILDLHECDVSKFNRDDIGLFFDGLVEVIDMVACERYCWDDDGVPEELKQTEPHTKGTSAVQFILTSSIVIHTLDILKCVYVNIFSCKSFDEQAAKDFTVKWFDGKIASSHFIRRI